MLKYAGIVNEKTSEFNYHHQGNESFNKKFTKDNQVFTNAFEKLENAFLEGDPLVHYKTKQFLSEKTCKSILDAKEIREKQSEIFVKERLI